MSQQPPPVPNPYGPPPHQPPPHQTGEHHPGEHQPGAHPVHPQPSGWQQGPPPGWQPPPRKRQRDSEPGRFTWWDLGAALFYLVFFLAGLGVLAIAFIPPIREMLGSEDEIRAGQGEFLVNAIAYVLLAAVTVAFSARALWRSLKRLNYLWWLKLLLVPVAWLLTLLLTAVLVMAMGEEPETSANQEAIEAMLGPVPFLAAVVVIGLLGPYVEEYFFRHLLVGKLSRHLNIWICGVISVLVFPLLHFIPALIGLSDDLSMIAVLPYLTMGIVITVGYIVTGRNLFYAWLLHAFNNVMSLVMLYYVQPWLEQYLEDQGIDPSELLRVILILL